LSLTTEQRRELVEAALGHRKLDCLIENVHLVNVFTGEVYPAGVGIYRGYIAHVEADPDDAGNRDADELEADQTIDGEGMYLTPGLIDSHVHIESSMMTPANFTEAVLPHGTTTVVTDPHEIANVLGLRGVKYMQQSSRDLPMRQYILAPSCVPSVPGLETTGAEFGSCEVAEMLEWERVIGVAEVMDFPGVIGGSERMRGIVGEALGHGMFVQGHCPELTGRALSAYLCAGPRSDHEIRFGDEAREKMRLGMTIDARESSISRNLAEILPAVRDFDAPPNLTLCTDDKEPADLLAEGHINHAVRRAIEEGLSPGQALRAATLQAARSVGLDELGAVAPGYAADLLLIPSLANMQPAAVMVAGEVVARDGKMVTSTPDPGDFPVERENTVHLDALAPETFAVRAPVGEGTVITRVLSYAGDDSLYASWEKRELPVRDGKVDISGAGDLHYVGVFNRHGAPENRFTGIIRNFGIGEGAVASTISHDCHNLTTVASNPEDAALAANALVDCGGGIACARGGEILALLELPVAGLISTLPAAELGPRTDHLKETLREMGLTGADPLLRIATLTLAVIPEAKITDQGLVDVNAQKLVPLFTDEQ